jgi:hypothetical protein
VVIDFNNGKCKNPNGELDAFCNVQLTFIASSDHSSIFEQINKDTQFKIEASSEDFDCGTSLHANAESSLKGCSTGPDSDR